MRTLIVVPAYKEAERLPSFLAELNFLNPNDELGHVTVRVVDDGSPEQTSVAMKRIVESIKTNQWTDIQFERNNSNQGKGATLRGAFLKGLSENFDVIGFLDADGSTSFKEMNKMLRYASKNQDVDVVIGSRWKCLGLQVERSFKRHLCGRIFATLVSNIFDIPVYDSQCGAKLFRTKVLSEKMLNFCDSDRWLFDTQLLILLYKKKIKIHEHPVSWIDKADSKVSLIKDSAKMFYGLMKYKNKLDGWKN